MTRRYDYDPPLLNYFFFLQIYTIHVNDLFHGENGEFRRKVTSLHPWVFLILQFPSIWYALVLKYIILSKFIIKAEVCYLLKCYILAGVNYRMLHLVRLSPLLYLYYIFLLQLQEDHEAPANPKTEQFTVVFQQQQKYDKNFWVELVLLFSYFY